MPNCLVIKLRESINNPALPYFNEVFINANNTQDKYCAIPSLQVGSNISIVNKQASGDYCKTLTRIVKVSPGDSLVFSGIDNLFGASVPVNTRVALFDNVNDLPTIDGFPNDTYGVLDSTMYNYNNFSTSTSVTLSVPSNATTQAATNLSIIITFLAHTADFDGNYGTGNIKLSINE